MKDIQSERDSRRINIQKVGVKTVTYPITVLDKARKQQHTVATVNMYVNLPHRFKGTHMSRFLEILNDFHGEIDINSFPVILRKMKDRLEAEASHLEIEFPYFLDKNGGGRGRSTGHYRCQLHGSLNLEEDLLLTVEVPISIPVVENPPRRLPGSYGRWGHAAVSVRLRHFFWIEDLILSIEEEVESEIAQLLARQRPVISVESLARRVGRCLEGLSAISWFSVTVHNFGDECATFATVSCP